ncbi:hypothetical protein LCGC14_1285580 [marine sediment metagenome]|uniref:Uncharacterized protein n=1 Tax=marine sediment metagenome TaxID=412755 RepID=A0A0F9NAM8_9ZZZZ
MQTEQPVVARVHVPLFSEEDVAKKRMKRSQSEIPNKVIAQALEIWVQHQGWIKPIPEDVLLGVGLTPFALGQLVYRYGHIKRMLPPEQWVPGWGRRPRKVKRETETPGAPSEATEPEWDSYFASVKEGLVEIDNRISGLAKELASHLAQVTPSVQLSGRVSVMDQEIVRLAGIIELEKAGSASLLERIIKIENKLRGGGRRGPTLLTRSHREVRRRLRILIAGGK